jgi:hypothetical protein
MPMIGSPLVASRPAPVRPVRLPQAVKDVIITMVDEGLAWTTAAQQHGVQLQRMRKWLGRTECIGFLRQQRARFRATVCAQNEFTLAQIRDDHEGNQMARVHAVRALEQLTDNEVARPSNAPQPGIQIVIRHEPAPIDITPRPAQVIDAGEPD